MLLQDSVRSPRLRSLAGCGYFPQKRLGIPVPRMLLDNGLERRHRLVPIPLLVQVEGEGEGILGVLRPELCGLTAPGHRLDEGRSFDVMMQRL